MQIGTLGATDLLQALPDPALVLDPDGMVQFANAAARRFLGIESTQGVNVTDFMPEQERQRLRPLDWLVRWADTPDAPELDFVHLDCRTADGKEVPVRALVGRLAGDPVGYVVILHDISRELARQRESRDAHRIAARVLAISADAVVNVDEAQTITYANASGEKLFGYPPGELVGKPLSTLLPESALEKHGAAMEAFARDPGPSRLMGDRGEVRGVTQSGEEIPLEASITKVTVDQGLIFSAHLRDLRPRRRAEKALAESQARFATVFEHALQAMALVDPEGRVVEFNDAARRLLRDDVEVIGAPIAELPWWDATSQADEADLNAALQRCRQGETYRTHSEIERPGGDRVGLDISFRPVVEHGVTIAIIAEARELG